MPPVKKPQRERLRTFLREWRLFRDMNQDDVAEKLEIDRSTISRIERAESPYDQDILERFALVYGCDPEDLLSIDPTRPDPPRLIYSKLRAATPAQQQMALDLIDAMLKQAS